MTEPVNVFFRFAEGLDLVTGSAFLFVVDFDWYSIASSGMMFACLSGTAASLLRVPVDLPRCGPVGHRIFFGDPRDDIVLGLWSLCCFQNVGFVKPGRGVRKLLSIRFNSGV